MVGDGLRWFEMVGDGWRWSEMVAAVGDRLVFMVSDFLGGFCVLLVMSSVASVHGGLKVPQLQVWT